MFKYYQRIRSVAPGTTPPGIKIFNVENFDDGKLFRGLTVFGSFETEERINAKDLLSFDLVAEQADEDKARICRCLCKTLQLTRYGSDLASIVYDESTEVVTIQWAGGGKRYISVEGDSGIAVIKDVMKGVM